MTDLRPRLAKLTAPAPARAYPRTRLFARLDAALAGRVVWLSAEAGAGKTTLVASYLAARGHAPLWYHLDRGDADPAAFFSWLARGIDSRTPLPSFTVEYFGGLDAFTRNYFRRLYAALPPQRVVVFDDYQEVDGDSLLHTVMRGALAEVPAGVTVLLISRNDPPAPLAGLRERDDFTLLGRADLLLSAEEAAGVCRLRGGGEPLGDALLAQLHRRAGGWMAGLVLLLEQLRDGGHCDDDAPLVFDYLAGEVFARMGADEQALLIRTALLPCFSGEAARSLTGLPHAPDLLEALHQRNYFTVRHLHGEEGAATYEYHPLFRLFLLEHGRRRLPAPEMAALKRAAAALLAAEGAVEECAALLAEIGDFAQLARVILRHAPGLLREGRYRTLSAWLGALPAGVREGDPWLLCFEGLAAMPFDLQRARAAFERAYEGFKPAAVVDGLYLAWAGVMDTYLYAWADFRPTDRWIDELADLRARHPGWPSPEMELRVTASTVAVLTYRRPDHPELPAWLDRLEALLFSEVDPVQRMIAASHLVTYLVFCANGLRRAAQLLERLRALGAAQASAPTPVRVSWAICEGLVLWFGGDSEGARALGEAALAAAHEAGLHLWDDMLLGQLVYAAITGGEPALATALLDRIEARLNPAQTLQVAHYHLQRMCLAAGLADPGLTLDHAQRALALARSAGVIWAEGLAHYGKGFAHHLRGEAAACEAELAWAERIWRERAMGSTGQGVLLVRAFIAADGGDETAIRRALGGLFEAMGRHGFNSGLLAYPARMSRLCALALRYGIDPDLARQLIRRCRLVPDPREPFCERWPWPVRIRTLGRFEVELEGRPLTFRGKAQRRPLELLQILLAHGGRQVPEGRIAEALWPEAEGDAAHDSFQTTLQRLRKLLGGNHLLPFREGLLTLDGAHCWVDLWALEALAEEDAEGWLRLYHGPFLAQERSAQWPAATRERLRHRFLGALRRRGEALAAEAGWAAAAALYERALRAEAGAEELYRGVMECHARQGRDDLLHAAWGRCCAALGGAGGPSPATRALYRRLTGAEGG